MEDIKTLVDHARALLGPQEERGLLLISAAYICCCLLKNTFIKTYRGSRAAYRYFFAPPVAEKPLGFVAQACIDLLANSRVDVETLLVTADGLALNLHPDTIVSERIRLDKEDMSETFEPHEMAAVLAAGARAREDELERRLKSKKLKQLTSLKAKMAPEEVEVGGLVQRPRKRLNISGLNNEPCLDK